MAKKIISTFLACMLIFSTLAISASAIGEVYYSAINYDTRLEKGTPVTGTMTWVDPIIISINGGTGAGRGYTVSLEEGKTYLFNFKATSSYAVTHVINVAILNNVTGTDFTKSVISTPALIHEYGTVAATSVRFTAPSTGYFKVLITEGSFTVDDYKMASVNYSVSYDDLVWEDVSISDADSLNALRARINSFSVPTAKLNVKLTSNINMLNEDWTDGIKFFGGKFDGQGYTVSQLGIGSNSIDNIGFFGKVMTNAEIKNLNVNVIYARGATSVGAVAGYAEYSTFENCSSSGEVAAAVLNAGGFVGDAAYSTFTSCYSSCKVTNLLAQSGGFAGYAGAGSSFIDCHATGEVNGTALVGGFIGTSNTGVSINNCYSTGNAAGTLKILGLSTSIGGFIGCSGTVASINECYSTGSATGGSGVGGFVGTLSSSSTIKNSYCTGDVLSAADSSLNTNFGGFAGTVTGGSNHIINCYTISNINVYGKTIGGFAGAVEALGNCEFINDYAAGSVIIRYAAENYGSFIGRYSDRNGVTSATSCFVSKQPISLNKVNVEAPVCFGYAGSKLSVSPVDFANADAVNDMTNSLNIYSNETEGVDNWDSSSVNAKNGPVIVFGTDGSDPFASAVNWVKQQNIIFQIPLWIFYIPVQFLLSLFN